MGSSVGRSNTATNRPRGAARNATGAMFVGTPFRPLACSEPHAPAKLRTPWGGRRHSNWFIRVAAPYGRCPKKRTVYYDLKTHRTSSCIKKYPGGTGSGSAQLESDQPAPALRPHLLRGKVLSSQSANRSRSKGTHRPPATKPSDHVDVL